jgi:hypothetical protein
MKWIKKIWLVSFFAVSLNGITGCDIASILTTGVQYTNPSWAPPYSQGVRYYYMPDIETYYDLTDQDFVYLNNGQWLFSPTLPSMYSGYDLYNGFVISLNINVFQPWMHHQYYVSNYPRYYYHNVYKDIDYKTIRGFNENERKPIYWKQEERDRINDLRRNDRNERKQEIIRPPQNTGYYGKRIGQPVKVRPNMKENRGGNNKEGNTREENNNRGRQN